VTFSHRRLLPRLSFRDPQRISLSKPVQDHEPGFERPLLTSLGLAVIDEIRFGPEKVISEVLGGSGTYCVFSHADLSRFIARESGDLHNDTAIRITENTFPN
jgi:hypothetical protein